MVTRFVGGVGVALLLTLALLTDRQVNVWQSDRTLWLHAMSVTPERPRPLFNAARALMLAAVADGDLERALALTDRALAQPPRTSRERAWALIGQTNRALVCVALRRPDDARIAVRAALRQQPDFEPAQLVARWLP